MAVGEGAMLTGAVGEGRGRGPEDERTSTSSDLKDLDTDDPMVCRLASGGYGDRCDVIIGVDGLHATGVDRLYGGRLVVMVESEPTVMGWAPAPAAIQLLVRVRR